MTWNLGKYSWRQWLSLLARLALGIVLLVAGISKALDFTGSVMAVGRFSLAMKIGSFSLIPTWAIEFLGYALPVIEIAVGLLLIVGLFTQVSGIIGGLLMVSFVVGIIFAWSKGISMDCGCFGSGSQKIGALDDKTRKEYLLHIIGDTALALCGGWLAFLPKSPFAVDQWLFAPISIHDFSDLESDDEVDDHEVLEVQ